MSKNKFNVGNIEIGAEQLFLISGPCVIENEKIMMSTAEELKKIEERIGVPIIYKSSFTKDNRSDASYYMGPGLDEGLKLLDRIKKDFGFSILSDVHYPEQITAAAEVLDIIQIPAYLCMQTTLALAAGNSGKVVNIKHGQFLAPENMIKPVKKIETTGNNKIILTERGFTLGYNDLVVDPRSFYHLQETGYPVVFDVTHSIRKYGIPSADPSGGARQYLDVLGRSAVGAGVDGLFVETHPCPSEALCDAASQLDITKLEEYMKPLIEIHNIVTQYR